jgi:glycosyltransferase involved in cell wall biosynthesis
MKIKMKKNVDLFYVHLFNDFSGSPRVFRDAINSGLTESQNTYVFTSKHKGFLDGVNAKRISCFYARSSNRYIQLFYFLLSQLCLFFQLSFWLLGNVFKKRKSTVVINTMLPFGAGLAAKIFADKVVYYVHETHIKPDLLKAFLRFFIQHCATNVIFVSKYLQRQERFNGIESDVVYNGLRTDFNLSDELDLNLKFEKKQLFFAGSLKLYKGIPQLFLLALHLPDFEVVAAINCEISEYEHFIANNTVPHNVTLYVRPSNIQELFKTSFLVLNLSLPEVWTETFGLSLLEGMAFGCPVISPPVGGPVEFVNIKNGLLVDARKTQEISVFILHLNSSFDIWNTYSREALLMSKKFTAEEYKKSLTEYFDKFSLI